MAGIYQRDNYAQLMQNALNNAYNRSAATQRERAERVKEIVNAGGDFAKVVGRTAEEWNVPDQYRDNPDYRAARFDYILSGDRSGLDAFRQAEAQAEQARKQQEFTAAENALNRRMQMAENEKNREIQRQQHGLEKATEKARLLRDVRDAEAILADMKGENKSKYNKVDRAKARNNYDLTVELLKKSGQFTADEIAKLDGNAAGGGNVPGAGASLDEQIAYARANGWQAPAAPAKESDEPESEPKKEEAPKENPAETWNKFNARYGELEKADSKQLDALEAEYAKHKKDEANADEYEKWNQGIKNRRKKLKDEAEAKQMKEARLSHFKDNVIPNITTVHVKKLLNGKTEATENRTWNYGGKEKPATLKYKLNANGSEADVYVDGEYAGKVPVKYSN